jgi:tripartite-type tricarboxylate transporter receptor subunit TctC
MGVPRRQFLRWATGAVSLSALPRRASALDYPTRPVRVIVGYAAGSAPDIGARIIGQWLSDRLGQQFVAENRPGAGPISRPKQSCGQHQTATRCF